MEGFSEFYIQKAKAELREDENRREQSMQQFRDWISKHPFITSIDIEPIQILAFLRNKKFSMDQAYESFNKTVIFTQNYPKTCDYSNIDRVMDLYDKGIFMIMKKRDAEGRRIVITRHRIFETVTQDFNEALALNVLLFSYLSLDPETQVSGVVVINDMRDISSSYMRVYQMDGMPRMITLATSMPLRLKQSNVIGLSTFANLVMEFYKSFANEKQKSRMNFLKSVDDLKTVMDVKILTKEFGGQESDEDCLSFFRDKIREAAMKYKKFRDSIKVNEPLMREYEKEKIFQGVGSFRKLEID